MKNPDTKKQRITRGILRTASLTALGMALTFALPDAAHAQSVTPPPVPAVLEVPEPNQAFLLGRGVGTQNYVCQPANSLGRVAWTLFTPRATLFDDQDEQLTTHFFSPNFFEGGNVRATWEDSRDTSAVWGRVIASVVVTPDAIPWLLVERAGTQAGPTGGHHVNRNDIHPAGEYLRRPGTREGV